MVLRARPVRSTAPAPTGTSSRWRIARSETTPETACDGKSERLDERRPPPYRHSMLYRDYATRAQEREAALAALCRTYQLSALYAFGSRGQEARDWVLGAVETLQRGPSDLDIGALRPSDLPLSVNGAVRLALALEDMFGVARVDLTRLESADAFLALNVIRGEKALDARPRGIHRVRALRNAACRRSRTLRARTNAPGAGARVVSPAPISRRVVVDRLERIDEAVAKIRLLPLGDQAAFAADG